MTGEAGRKTRHISSTALVLLVAVSLMLPASNFVLCIAPDGHTAIEDFSAECCTSPAVSTQESHDPDGGLNAVKECGDCTDYFISPNACSSLRELFNFTADELLAGEGSRCLVPQKLFLQSVFDSSIVSIRSAYTVPLRC